MTNQSSIRYLSCLLDIPGTITAGDMNSMKVFRQTYPYFIPARYVEAVEQHRHTPFSPQMMAGVRPYLGNWMLFHEFLQSGAGVTKPVETADSAVLAEKSEQFLQLIRGDHDTEEPEAEPELQPEHAEEEPFYLVPQMNSAANGSHVRDAMDWFKNTRPLRMPEEPTVRYVVPIALTYKGPAPVMSHAPLAGNSIFSRIRINNIPGQELHANGAEQQAMNRPFSFSSIVIESQTTPTQPAFEATETVRPEAEHAKYMPPMPPANEKPETRREQQPVNTKKEEQLAVVEEVIAKPARRNDVVEEATEVLNYPEEEDTLIFPIYTNDYFLQQGEKIPDEIPEEISELVEPEDKDKSLMVMMSFSEWLLHFKNTAKKQEEEKKDQRALKSMWQKEKLAAAMEEENEEIPENVFEMAVNSITKEDGLASESLADIYIKQGKFDKAIEMYRKLSLRNPQKNAYFAAKIEEVLKEKQL